MPRKTLALASLALLLLAPDSRLPAQDAPANACSNLKDLRLPDVRLTEVTDIPDSADHNDHVRAPHCRVSGVISKEILFVVMLPNRWNQRLMMGGNGGFAGSINDGVQSNATSGYVTVSTNTGHQESDGTGAKWALNQPERQINYAFLAVHRTVEVAKVLAKAFYGSEPAHSYFLGCSNGGRQALTEVERYPDDFDGVMAGAPAIPFSAIFASFVKNTRVAYPTPASYTRPVVTQAALDLLAARVLEACDAADGVKDGVLDDPRDCKFKLASLPTCGPELSGQPGRNDHPGRSEGSAVSCLTAAQRAAIAAIYAPARDASGSVVYPGQPFGGENLDGGWGAWIVGSDTAMLRTDGYPSAQPYFAVEGARYITFGDPAWDYTSYRGDIYKEGRRTAAMYDADDADISRFTAHKGKLILWHGWADPALNPLETVEYYQKVLAKDPKARDYVRLFMLPGVLHCAGGNGPSNVSWLRSLVDWVEKGTAPEQLNATKRDTAGKSVRTRPLCAYPKRAAYKGSGSTDDASNFACRE